MNSSYMSPLLRNLCAQQLAAATREQLIAGADRSEKLISELPPNEMMAFGRISQKITGCADSFDSTNLNEQLNGAILQHDLRLIVEDFTDAADINSDEVIEPVYTVKTLGTHLQVSSKTISRWRNNGLVSRKIIIEGRKRVAFLASTVDRFVAQNRHRVQRGERFSQLSKSEKMDILDQARKLAAAGACPSEVAKRLANHFSRSIETVRYTLKRHDKKNPAEAIFPRARGKLSEDSKRSIFQRYRQGTSVSMLARQFNRTSSTVHRIINEMRATQILELPLDFMPNAEFSYRGAEKRLMAPIP
ncbi:MAG: RNA polymerase subunit sigma-70, partial [Planctomycetaceae bacterium]|nr:RNA polymerase subunit sigma-70 [Planctomycetaceae bacterium]